MLLSILIQGIKRALQSELRQTITGSLRCIFDKQFPSLALYIRTNLPGRTLVSQFYKLTCLVLSLGLYRKYHAMSLAPRKRGQKKGKAKCLTSMLSGIALRAACRDDALIRLTCDLCRRQVSIPVFTFGDGTQQMHPNRPQIPLPREIG
jgi:hypothetical protein